uniref:Uncharacterized protein n=1 Tax=Brassica oleracea TaxID=3712 RepID=A0A3P6FPP4_BRAOL|nr:unnamed protein product [Brassica oleracea]
MAGAFKAFASRQVFSMPVAMNVISEESSDASCVVLVPMGLVLPGLSRNSLRSGEGLQNISGTQNPGIW